MRTVKIGNKQVGPGQPCYVIAEIGINHNGDVDLAKRLISVAVAAGCDAVKFQKRTVDVVYTAKELATPARKPLRRPPTATSSAASSSKPRTTPRSPTSASQIKIDWFVSPWDEGSVDFMEQFNTPVYKIASASLTDDHLLRHIRKTGKPVIASTGMSTYAEIDHAVEVLGKDDLILMHTTSTYPAKYEQLNLRAIPTMAERYGVPVGYSGHETGIPTSVAAAVLGACCVERHITMDRAMWGSDQAASLEPNGISRLVRDIRLCEQSMGDGIRHRPRDRRAKRATTCWPTSRAPSQTAKAHFALELPEGLTANGTFVAADRAGNRLAGRTAREVFGPVLHIVRYRRADLPQVVDGINATGYGLTLGVHSRIDETIDFIAPRAHVGNIYVNRNIVGAVVGVQPFGGEGKSGTGPKAGGPLYLKRLQKDAAAPLQACAAAAIQRSTPCWPGPQARPARCASRWPNCTVAAALVGVSLDLPGPTGERNSLSFAAARPRAVRGGDAGRADEPAGGRVRHRQPRPGAGRTARRPGPGQLAGGGQGAHAIHGRSIELR